ncbi:MAG: MFS transporter [Balneola sp.]|nr:MFS transporter [Balneola sp.]
MNSMKYSTPKEVSKGMWSWALFDWANSAFFVIIQTFVFAAYFQRSIAADSISGTEQWGNMVSVAGLLIAFTAPILGAIADRSGRRKPWIAAFSLVSIVASFLLWFAEPRTEFLMYALIVTFIATVGAEYAFIFYNAMLPDLVPPSYLGRWSGWSWAMGFAGGIACLLGALYLFIESEGAWLGLDTETLEHIRATFIFTALWYLVFSIPMFLRTPDIPKNDTPVGQVIREGLQQLKNSIKQARKYANIYRFLLARMIYNDAIILIYAFGGIYAAGTFAMDESQIIIFGIGLNVTAALGAVGFSWMDDRSGSKKTILLSLLGLIIPVTAILFVEDIFWFWIWGLMLGVFFGPVQAASRTLMGRLAPEDKRTEMFGLFAFSGKATAFIGPKLLGWVTVLFASQRIGMSVVLALLAFGFLLMLRVQEPDKIQQTN